MAKFMNGSAFKPQQTQEIKMKITNNSKKFKDSDLFNKKPYIMQ